jgi:hypothetical protein
MLKKYSISLALIVLSIFMVCFCLPQVSIAGDILGDVSVRAVPENWGGKCPHTFKFNGSVQVYGPGSFNYHWVRSDGAKSPVQIVTVRKGQRVAHVNDTWAVGAKGMKIDISQTLYVNSGNQHLNAQSNTIPVNCMDR